MSDHRKDGPTPAATDPRLDVWRAFLKAHARLFRRLDEELRDEHGLSLPEYDALLQIGQSPGRRMRMNQIAERVLLSKSGVTRLIDRLVLDGYVERSQCSDDGRGAEAVLTAVGLERLREAASTHLRGIERYFFAAVDAVDLPTLARTMESVARTSGGDVAGSDACEPALVEDAPVRSAAGPRQRAGRAPAAERAPAG